MSIKKLLIGVLAGTMVLGMTAWATGDTEPTTPANTDAKGQTVTALDNAYLVKYIEIADGTELPEGAAFTFTLTSDDSSQDPAPAINPVVLTVAANSTASASTADGKSIILNKKLSEIFTAASFTHAGVYTYKVVETKSAYKEQEAAGGATLTVVDNQLSNGGNKTTETIKNSSEEYKINIIVKNGPNGPEVQGATVSKTEPDGEDDEGNPKTKETKVTPDPDPSTTSGQPDTQQTPPGDDNTEGGQADTIPGFSFTNVYTKKIQKPLTPNPEDPTVPEAKYAALGVTKTVVGDYGDRTFKFPFSLTMQASAGVRDETATAYIISGTGTDSDPFKYYDATGAAKADKAAGAITVTFGTPLEFKLTHGQALVFEELPSGVSYTVSEGLASCGVKDVDSYTATSNHITTNTAGADLAAETTPRVVADDGGKDNDTYVKNTIDDESITNTGIVINNLPYILMVAIAAVGFVFFGLKRRQY